jgi:hypothetical protein
LASKDIVNHDRSGADGTAPADPDSWDHDRSHSDQRLISDLNLTGQSSPRCDMNAASQRAVVVDAGPRVDDPAQTNSSVGLHDGSGHDDRTGFQLSGRRDDRGVVNEDWDGVTLTLCDLKTAFPRGIVSDGHEDLASTVSSGRGQVATASQNRRPVELMSVALRVFLEKPDDVPTTVPREIGDDLGMSTGSPDQQSHGWLAHEDFSDAASIGRTR